MENYFNVEYWMIFFGSSLLIFGCLMWCALPLSFYLQQKTKRKNDLPPTYDKIYLSKKDLPKFKDAIKLEISEQNGNFL